MSDANQGRAGRKTINRSPTSPFAANLKKVFWNSGQSQAEAAEGLGVSRQTFNNWINGQNQPDYASLVRIADYFRVSTDYLLGRTETVSPDTSIAGCGKLTGLSDKSIEKLIELYRANWENWYTYLLNDIIEADEFQLFLESLMNYVTTSDEEVKSISLDDSITNRDVYELKTNRLFHSIVQHLIAVYKPRLSEYNKAMSDAFVSKIVNGLHDAGGITDELWQEAMETYEKSGNPYKVLYDSISKEEGDDTDNGEYHPAQE